MTQELTNQNSGQLRIVTDMNIDIRMGDLSGSLKTSANNSIIIETARKVLDEVHGLWEPCAVVDWFDFETALPQKRGRLLDPQGDDVTLKLGRSVEFMESAQQAMVSVYTIGDRLDTASTEASSKGRLLEAYIMDHIGLAALEKTGAAIKKMAEQKAKNLGWGVSPFLSPGSVHGWEIHEQSKLCGLIPIERLGIKIKNSGVLYPVKTVAAMIGIGPGYDRITVGSTCEVCNNRDNCQMRGQGH